jgi:cytochrome c oxidase subunit 2
VWPAIFHRAPKNGPEFPRQTQYNVPVEVAYTIIPFVIVAVLFYFTVVKENEIVKPQASVQHEIEVSGFQWSWQFTYLDEGKNVQVTGTPAKPPVLVVPQGERVRYTIVSNDVVHGFWIPEFMIQMQNLPGVTNYLEFTANKLGDFPGRCNILCGRNHAQMLFTVRVVTPAEYETYISNLKLETEKASQA